MNKISRNRKTPFGYVLDETFDKLSKAGWSFDRDDKDMVLSYSEILGKDLSDYLKLFVRNMGGINVDNKLSIGPIPEHALRGLEGKISEVVGSRVVPIASSTYLGDGCLIWIDEVGRCYAVDSEGMIFIGDDVAMALDVLVGGEILPKPPQELAEKIERAYDWG